MTEYVDLDFSLWLSAHDFGPEEATKAPTEIPLQCLHFSARVATTVSI